MKANVPMTSDAPRVSVIMAAYRTEQAFFEASVRSVLRQTLADFEFIVVDDGLTHENRLYLSRVNDPRLTVLVNEENIGQSRSVNRALSLAKGEYIARMDSDDVMTADRLEVQVAYMDRHPNFAACAGLAETTDHHRILSGSYPDESSLEAGLFFSNDLVHPTMFFRRSVIDKYELRYDEQQLYAQDYKMWTDLLACGGIGIVNHIVLHYRVHPGQISVDKRDLQDEYAERAQRLYFDAHGFESDDIDFETHRKFVRGGLSGEYKHYHYYLNTLLRQAITALSDSSYRSFEQELRFRAVKAGIREVAQGGSRLNGLRVMFNYGLRFSCFGYYLSRLPLRSLFISRKAIDDETN